MARVDDFKQARDLAAEHLKTVGLEEIAAAGGYAVNAGKDALVVPFLDYAYQLSYPGFEFSLSGEGSAGDPVPLHEQVLLLHYLKGALDKTSATDNPAWIAYREIPGAAFYNDVFGKRALNPLKNVFGRNLDGFREAAGLVGGKETQGSGDAAFVVQLLPRIAVQLMVYEPDEDFGAEANILFSKTIAGLLSPEDAAWLAGLVVYRMCAMAAPRK